MALRSDVNVEFLDNEPTTSAEPHYMQRVDPEAVRELKGRIRTVGRQQLREVAERMFNDRWSRPKQRAYAKIARQLGVSPHAIDTLFGINTGSMHAPRVAAELPEYTPEFPRRVLTAAWGDAPPVIRAASGRTKAPKRGGKQLQLPGTEGPDAPAAAAPEPEAAMPDAGPLEVVVRQRGRGEMRFAVRNAAEISKLTKVLEGLL